MGEGVVGDSNREKPRWARKSLREICDQKTEDTERLVAQDWLLE